MPVLVKKLFISLASVVLVLGGLEGVLRARRFWYPSMDAPIVVWNPHEDRDMRLGTSMHERDPRMLWYPKPGRPIPWGENERVNAAGYRGPEASLEKRPGVLRIVTLGDSSTFGFGVPYEETYSAQLVELLAERGIAAEVLCGGVVGYSLRQGLERYRIVFRGYKPDVVVAAFGAVNDHHEAIDKTDDRLIGEEPPKESMWTEIRLQLRRHVRILHLIAMVQERSNAEIQKKRNSFFVGEREQHKRRQRMGQVDWEGRRRVPLSRFPVFLDELASEVAADGAKLVLLSMPRQVAAEESAPVLLEYTKLIEQFARERNLPLADGRTAVLNALKTSSASDLFVDYYHPTRAGHRILAESIVEALKPIHGELKGS
jgi:lysophospholipase L1-like esterase